LGLAFTADGAWNLATAVALGVTLYYTYGVWSAFKGGKIEKSYAYMVWGVAVLLLAFVVRFAFDLADITPIDVYGVSVRDCGVLVALVLFCFSARGLRQFWRGEAH
jgi:hypothetical protein